MRTAQISPTVGRIGNVALFGLAGLVFFLNGLFTMLGALVEPLTTPLESCSLPGVSPRLGQRPGSGRCPDPKGLE